MSREDEYCSDDRKVLRKAEDSLIKLPDNLYHIAMSWKNDPKDLLDNFQVARK